jgi:hypothetical protein
VLVKLLFIGYLFGVRSERQLMREGYGHNEPRSKCLQPWW